MRVRVVLEQAPKRSFASALDWPGWSRGGKTVDAAADALIAYAPRYAAVADRAGLAFEAPAGLDDLEVVERAQGGGSTEFGVPSVASREEETAVEPGDLERLTAILRASWATFDAAVTAATGATLATGPRGGGRTLEKIVEHVRDAEVAYLGQLGSRPPPGMGQDPVRGLEHAHEAFLATLVARVRDEPLPHPRRTRKPWSPRYAVRRTAWHVLDHAWEIEDRVVD
jgi:hypothetical protein